LGFTRVAVLRLAVVAGLAGALEAACRLGAIPRTSVIPPSDMALALSEVLIERRVLEGLGETFGSVLIAFALAVSCGIGGGLVIHALPLLRRAVSPLLAAWYAIPHFAFYPLFIVLLGLGRASLVALALMLSGAAMTIATLDGLDRERRVLTKQARIYRLGTAARIRLIRLPAALPHLIGGLKLAFVYSFIGVIAGEFILSTSGLGHEISYAYDNFETRRMYGLILLTLVLAVSINLGFRAYERRLARVQG